MKKILGIFMLIAGIVIAVGASSATFAYFEATRDVHVNVVPDDDELIDLVPMQDYAYISGNGELVIELSRWNDNWKEGYGLGVSPNSTYIFEHMFGVSNHLWENVTICVTISYSESGTGEAEFFVGDYYDGIPTDTELSFTLAPGEVLPIGMVIDSSGVYPLPPGDPHRYDEINGNIEITATLGSCD